MNIKQLTVLLMLSASAGAVLADSDIPMGAPSSSTVTRAQVVAELKQAPKWDANGDGNYPVLPVAQSDNMCHQVVAISQADVHDNSLYSGS